MARRMAIAQLTKARLGAPRISPWQKLDPSEVDDRCSEGHPLYDAYQICSARSTIPLVQIVQQGGHLADLAKELTLHMESAVAHLAAKPNLPHLPYAVHLQLYDDPGGEHQKKSYIGSNIILMSETIAPLLDKNLSESERLVQQFLLAKIVRPSFSYSRRLY
jgi:hypothetical protein